MGKSMKASSSAGFASDPGRTICAERHTSGVAGDMRGVAGHMRGVAGHTCGSPLGMLSTTDGPGHPSP